jgi:hypothetical protein
MKTQPKLQNEINQQRLQDGWHQTPMRIETTMKNYHNIKENDKNKKSKKKPIDINDFNVYHNNTAQRLPFVQSLTGRGQDGLAGFFGNKEDDSQQFLVKIDDPATCILEGTARFAKDLMLPTNPHAVNFATAGLLRVDNKAAVISVQDKVDAKPWDKIVYGKKRNPKTLISKEALSKKSIQNNITNLTDKAQWDLANALFVSTAVGDESLHVGQFMAKTNENGEVTGITRIDFGARERFSAERFYQSDFNHKTSQRYASSGQKGKDYISYLLNQKDLKQKYLTLWSRKMDIEGTAKKHADIFHEEMRKLPKKLQKKALDDILKTMFKKSDELNSYKYNKIMSLPLDQKKQKVAKLLKKVTIKRMTTLQKKARAELLNNINNEYKKMNKKMDSKGQEVFKNLIHKSDDETVNELVKMNKYFNKQIQKGNPNFAENYHNIAQTIIARQELAEHADISKNTKCAIKEQLQEMKERSLRLKMIGQLRAYNTGSSKKQKLVNNAIIRLRRGEAPHTVIDESFKKIISKKRGLKSNTNGGKLYKELAETLKEYKASKSETNAINIKDELNAIRREASGIDHHVENDIRATI